MSDVQKIEKDAGPRRSDVQEIGNEEARSTPRYWARVETTLSTIP